MNFETGGEASSANSIPVANKNPETDFDLLCNFTDIADQIRPVVVEIDESWQRTEAIKRAVLADVIDIVVRASDKCGNDSAGGSTNREMRRQNDANIHERFFSIAVEAIAFSVRHGMHKNVPNSPVLSEFEGLPESTAVLSIYVNSAIENVFGYYQVDGEAEFLEEGSIVIASLAPQLATDYELIYKATKELVAHTSGYVEAGIPQAESFVAWLKQVREDEEGDYRAYLQMLAQDLLDNGQENQDSVLTQALDKLRTIASETLQGEFLDALLSGEVAGIDSKIQEWTKLIAKIIETTDPVYFVDPAEIISSLESTWPAELKEAFQTYANGRIDFLQNTIKELLKNYVIRSRCTPTEERLNLLIGETRNATGREAGSRKRSSGKAKGRRLRAKPSLRQILGVSDIETSLTPNNLAVLKQSPDGFLVDINDASEEIDAMVERYAKSYPQETGLRDSISSLVKAVLDDPFGPGTKNLKGQVINLVGHNGKKVPLRNATTRKNVTVKSSGNVSYRTRVIYCVISGPGGDSVAIREILHHNEQDAKYNPS